MRMTPNVLWFPHSSVYKHTCRLAHTGMQNMPLTDTNLCPRTQHHNKIIEEKQSAFSPVLYPGVSHAPGSSPGSNHHAGLHYEASLGAACCSLGTGWVTSLWTDVFSCQRDPSVSTQRAYHILSTWGLVSSSVCLKYS